MELVTSSGTAFASRNPALPPSARTFEPATAHLAASLNQKNQEQL